MIYKTTSDNIMLNEMMEIWEPIISHLSGSAIQLVDEIWSWEAVQHGDAALLNAMNISGACVS